MPKQYEEKVGMIKLFNINENQTELMFYPDENYKVYTHAIAGSIYEVISWMDGVPFEMMFVCEFTVKWDGCSHYYFYGEDFEQDDKEIEDKDSYYHLCGVHSYLTFMRALVFAYALMIKKVGIDQILENDEINELKKLKLLEGYEAREIVEEESIVEV